MTVESIPTSASLGVPTASSPSGWFAGAGDEHDHAIRFWIPDSSGYLSTACGKPSAQAGRSLNRPCPECTRRTAASQRSQITDLNALRLIENLTDHPGEPPRTRRWSNAVRTTLAPNVVRRAD